MTSEMRSDLSVEVFLALRKHFFDDGAAPEPYTLRDKRNTQDDPLDEFICELLQAVLPSGAKVAASGPLVTPDLVIHRPAICSQTSRADLRASPDRILALEVKKLERGASGDVARASGLDYNTMPPCGTVRVYDLDGDDLDIKGCYLFVCQEPAADIPRTYRLTALVLCDGDLLNEDFDYYISIVGRRSKEIGLGTYGDGAKGSRQNKSSIYRIVIPLGMRNCDHRWPVYFGESPNRVRPMLIFSNPLGAPFLDRQSTLIHARADLEAEYPALRRTGVIKRSIPRETGSEALISRPSMEQTSSGEARTFHCYRDRRDVAASTELFHERDPFPMPRRSRKTAARGRFVISFRPSR